jgi:hypothetical protein
MLLQEQALVAPSNQKAAVRATETEAAVAAEQAEEEEEAQTLLSCLVYIC